MTEDACGECIYRVTIRSCITGAVIFTESQVIPRRAAIIRQGRRLQNWLRLPEFLRTSSDPNPGMTDRDIRLGTAAIGISAFLSFAGLVAVNKSWPLWAPAFFWLGSSSFCIVGLAWLRFALARRRRQATGYGPAAADEEDLEEGQAPVYDPSDPELQQTALWIWADIRMYG